MLRGLWKSVCKVHKRAMLARVYMQCGVDRLDSRVMYCGVSLENVDPSCSSVTD